MAYPILETKLQAPRLRNRMLARPALLQRLNEGLADGRALTLVCAPAGYGKTTLVSAWLEHIQLDDSAHTGIQSAWLSLDEQDDQIPRLLAYLCAALQKANPKTCMTLSQGMNNPQQPSLESLFTLLINDLSHLESSIFLILDDLQSLQADDTRRFIRMMSENLPPQLHLILISRQEPFLPLARLRSRNLITEIHSRDLRFNDEEASHFLSDCMRLELKRAHIEELARLTEGWAAGLQLAGLSMQGQPDHDAFIQNYHYDRHFVIDYLAGEVLNKLSPELRDFLYTTSILERFNPPLCDAVSGCKDSRQMLQQLEEKNLFLISLDMQQSWYRYHHLFADMLRHNLRIQKTKEDIEALHRRAAQWFEANGHTGEAIQHACNIADWPYLQHIIQRHANECFQQGAIRLLLDWFHILPQEIIEQNPSSCSDYAWALALTNHAEEADRYFILAEQAFQQDKHRLGQVLTGRAYLAYNQAEPQHCLDLGKQALELLPEENRWMKSVCHLTQGLAHWDLLDLQACREDMQAVLNAGSHAAGRNRVTALAYLGHMKMVEMDFDVAREFLEAACVSAADGSPSPGSDVAFTFSAYLSYELNRLEEARQYIENGLRLCRLTGNTLLLTNQYGHLARILRADGKYAQAQEALLEGKALTHNQSPNSYASIFLQCLEADFALDRHELSLAADLLLGTGEEIYLPFLGYPGLVKVRWLLANGETLQAETLLEHLRHQARQAAWPFTLFRIDLMRSSIRPGSEKSRYLLSACLEQAEPHKLLRPMLDMGESMREALLQANFHQHAPHLAASSHLILQSLLPAEADTESMTTLPTSASSRHQNLIFEALTDRELEVLQLLVEESAYEDIARRMVLSTNTIKSHVKHIYGKLGVNNRRDALIKARSLHLLR